MIESNYLKDDVRNVEKLCEIQTFQRLDILELGTLLKISKIRQYEDGECIIAEGENDRWLYVLLSGRGAVVKAGIRLGTIADPGEMFGEMRILDQQSRSASVLAVGKTVCLALDTAATHRVYSENDITRVIGLLYKVISVGLSRRLRRMNDELVEIRRKNARLQQAAAPTSIF